jgi:hypothetical protein
VGTSREELLKDMKTKSDKCLFTLTYNTVQRKKVKNYPVLSNLQREKKRKKNSKREPELLNTVFLVNSLNGTQAACSCLVLTTDLPLVIKNSTSDLLSVTVREPVYLTIKSWELYKNWSVQTVKSHKFYNAFTEVVM